MRSMPLVNAVEDRIIDPIGNRLSWFSRISSIFDVIIPIELTTSVGIHILYMQSTMEQHYGPYLHKDLQQLVLWSHY